MFTFDVMLSHQFTEVLFSNLNYIFSDKKTGTLALIIELLDMNLYEVIKGKIEQLVIVFFMLILLYFVLYCFKVFCVILLF